ncbi:MAG: hypothetical protein JRG91_17820, partial [Deltaproteobacteria bacterium]|nr:hypothetical protein [Deltaproteobacteria bacterium]
EMLAALPTPPRRRTRNPWLMSIVVVLSILILWWFRFEVTYFFSSSEPENLGSAVDLDPADLSSNAYVTVEAWPNPTRAVKFQRRFRKAVYRVVPAVGQKRLFLQTERKLEGDGEGEEEPSSDVSQLEGRYTGRLISFGDLESTFLTRSGYKSVRLFFREKLFVEITDDCFLLIDGVTPRSYWGYLLLALIVAGFGLANAVLLVRTIVQRLRKRSP